MSQKYALKTDPPFFVGREIPMPPPLGEGATIKDMALHTMELYEALGKANITIRSTKEWLDGREGYTLDELSPRPEIQIPPPQTLLPVPFDFACLLLLIFACVCCIAHFNRSKEARTRIGELEKELATAKGTNTTPICDGKGLPAVVCRMRREGKNEKEIAQYLSDKGDQGCSNPQIGALVHPTAEIGITTSETMTKYAQRLLDKA